MPRREKLTADQKTYVKRVAAIRRRLLRRLRKLPTNAKLAIKFGCSSRVIDRCSTENESAATPHVPRETESRFQLRVTDAEFAQLMRTE